MIAGRMAIERRREEMERLMEASKIVAELLVFHTVCEGLLHAALVFLFPAVLMTGTPKR